MMKNRLKILIADDEENVVTTLADILELRGYEVKTACSGLEALNKVKKNAFHCVITDIKMPKMDGIELCRAIKKIKPKLPVVLISGYVTNKLMKEAQKAEPAIILRKPFNPMLLLKFLADLCKSWNSISLMVKAKWPNVKEPVDKRANSYKEITWEEREGLKKSVPAFRVSIKHHQLLGT